MLSADNIGSPQKSFVCIQKMADFYSSLLLGQQKKLSNPIENIFPRPTESCIVIG